MSDFNTFEEDLGAVRIRCDGDASAGEMDSILVPQAKERRC